jgi:hypothetical protein
VALRDDRLEKLPDTAPTDRRQSVTALAIARGVRRLLRAQGWSALAEVPLANGRRADLVAIDAGSVIHIIEIKSSVADFRADHKWETYRDYCDHLSFAVTPDMPLDLLPEHAGLIVADSYGAEILRPPPHHPLAPARRRAMLLRFAQLAADRLHDLADPQARLKD